MDQTHESSLLDRLFESVSDCLTPEAARRLVELRAEPALQERIDLLADKCTEGELTPEEREEYETYLRASRFVGILQAKARKRLSTLLAA